jgi:hypothetical protein
VSPSLVPTVVWVAAMAIGLVVTLRALADAIGDLGVQRALAPGDTVLEEMARRNVRAEALRSWAIACFGAAGILVLLTQLGHLPAALMPAYRWLFTGLLLAGGLSVVANSVLDARHRRRVLSLALRGRR